MTDPQHEETFADTERKLREIITTPRECEARLRAQLAEARAERDIWEIDAKRNHQAAEIEFARANRAEAALAAQIEADAGIVDDMRRNPDFAGMGCDPIIDAIRDQPHDRTALDRMLTEAREVSEADKIAIRNKALREAAQACDWGDIYGDNAVRTILALLEKEKTE